MIKIFIGYDWKEVISYHVLCESIMKHATRPVSITPLRLNNLKHIFKREQDPKQSTDFSFSRFLIPYLCDYEGWAIFMDCDMLITDDIVKLWNLADDQYSVMCVKHDQEVKDNETKSFGAIQHKYEKKNWSSLMLFNNEKCKALTKDYVNTATGLQLHQFKWLGHDYEIGSIPKTWNFLVGYDELDEIPKNIHYTKGGPYIKEYEKCLYNELWFEMKQEALFVNNNS